MEIYKIFNFIMVKSQRDIQPERGDDRVKNQFINPFYISKFSATVFVDRFSNLSF